MDINSLRLTLSSSGELSTETDADFLEAALRGLKRVCASRRPLGRLLAVATTLSNAHEAPPLLDPRKLVLDQIGPEPLLAMLAVLSCVAPSKEIDRLAALLIRAWLGAPSSTAIGAPTKSTVDSGFRYVRQWATGQRTLGSLRDKESRPYVLALATLRGKRDPIHRVRGKRKDAVVPSPPGTTESGGRGARRLTRAIRARTHPRVLRQILGGGRSYRFAARARHASGHVLPFGSRSLILPYDRARLREYMRDASAVDQAVIAAVLLGGQSPERLTEWRVALDINTAAGMDAEACLAIEPFGLVLPNRINAALPKPPGHETPAERIYLPFPRSGVAMVEALHAHALARLGGQLFTADEVAQCRTRLRAYASTVNSTLRLERLSREVLVAGFDVTERRAFEYYLRSARSIEPAFAADLHYALHDGVELQEIYAEALSLVGRRHGITLTPSLVEPSPIEGTIGSRFCPSGATVSAFVDSLKVALPPLRRGRPDPAEVIRFHNAYTNYVMAMFMTASGIRPFALGFPALRPLNDTWLVDEKPQGGSSARLLRIPKLVLRQWQHYELHRKFVIKTLGLSNAPQWFYLHDEAPLVRPLSPASWRKVMDPEAANALRHWLSNALRRHGWPGERISLLMGHHPRGWEPGAPWSAIEVSWTADETNELEAVVLAAGFEERKGYRSGS